MRKMTVAALFFILFIYAMFRFSAPLSRHQGFIPNDFHVFKLTVDRLEKGEVVYQATDASPFKYSPAFLMAYKTLLAPMSAAQAWFFYCMASLLSWLGAFYIFVQAFLRRSTIKPTIFYLAFAFGLVASWHGFLEHLSYGQADFLIASFAVFGTAAAALRGARNQILAGLCMAIALLIKPTALILFTGLAWSGALGALLWGALMTLALLGLTFFYTGSTAGVALCRQWVESLGQQPSVLFSGNLNQNLGAVLARDFSAPDHAETLAKISLGLAVIIFCIACIKGFTKRNTTSQNPDWTTGLATSMGIYLCATPLSWRWMTFLWWPLTLVVALGLYKNKNNLAPKVSFGVFAVIVLLLQAFIAHALGIAEVDVLSYWGLYGWGSFLLLVCLLLQKTEARIKG